MLYFVGFYLNKHVLYKVNGIIFQLHCFWHSDKLYLQRPDLLGFQFGYQMGGICVVSRESRCWNCKNNTHCLRCANCKIARYCGAECQNKIGEVTLFCAAKLKVLFQIIRNLHMKVTLQRRDFVKLLDASVTDVFFQCRRKYMIIMYCRILNSLKHLILLLIIWRFKIL